MKNYELKKIVLNEEIEQEQQIEKSRGPGYYILVAAGTGDGGEAAKQNATRGKSLYFSTNFTPPRTGAVFVV